MPQGAKPATTTTTSAAARARYALRHAPSMDRVTQLLKAQRGDNHPLSGRATRTRTTGTTPLHS
jgi:hypothetical protein